MNRIGGNITIYKVLTIAILVFFLIVSLAPFFLVWSAAFKDKADLIDNIFGIPSTFHFANIQKAWIQGHFGTYYKNSIIVVIPVVLGTILFSITNAYAFAYFRIPAKEIVFGLILLGMTIPMEVVIIQLYYHLLNIGLLNTLRGLVLAQIGMGIPFGTFFLRGTLKEFPKSLVEAAEIDGAGTPRILIKILVPMAGPAIMTLIVFFFTWTWNEFLLTLVIIHKDSLRTLPVGMAFFQGRYVGDTPLVAMGATLMTLPIILLYVALQKYVISGITAGALKE
jgi:raffinose/stachyose/melibiose transport system permease protein